MRWFIAVSSAAVLSLFQLAVCQPALADVTPGKQSLGELIENGEHSTLLEAFNKARHAILIGDSEGNTEFWAQTPTHGLSSYFDERGLQLTVQTPDSNSYRSAVSLKSIGYGQSLHKVDGGEISSKGNRISIDRWLVSEWYINRSTGLEQGFTLRQRPSGYSSGENLQLVLSVNGDLVPSSSADGQAVALSDRDGGKVLQYAGLKVWDATGRLVQASMETTGQRIVIQVADAGAQYPLTIDPTYTQQAYLKASNTGSSDYFGESIALDSDTLVVGGSL